MPQPISRRDFLRLVPAAAAGGVAAWLALDSDSDVATIDTQKLRAALKNQGAVVL